eukprot:6375619-Pyramimonas_sp.AAC.1
MYLCPRAMCLHPAGPAHMYLAGPHDGAPVHMHLWETNQVHVPQRDESGTCTSIRDKLRTQGQKRVGRRDKGQGRGT